LCNTESASQNNLFPTYRIGCYTNTSPGVQRGKVGYYYSYKPDDLGCFIIEPDCSKRPANSTCFNHTYYGGITKTRFLQAQAEDPTLMTSTKTLYICTSDYCNSVNVSGISISPAFTFSSSTLASPRSSVNTLPLLTATDSTATQKPQATNNVQVTSNHENMMTWHPVLISLTFFLLLL
jgi:hypothetical protein